jgi:hypothetical protein
MGISIEELLTVSVAVNEKAQKANLSISAADYRIIEELEKYNKIGDLQNEISSLAIQRHASNQMTAPRDEAITALLKIQCYGISDEEVLNLYEYLNRTHPNIRQQSEDKTETQQCGLKFGNSHLFLQSAHDFYHSKS